MNYICDSSKPLSCPKDKPFWVFAYVRRRSGLPSLPWYGLPQFGDGQFQPISKPAYRVKVYPK